MTAPLPVPSPIAPEGLQNKFLLVVLAFQRSRQLQGGARPRVDTDGHKFLWVAMREATSGLVSWDLVPAAVPAAPR